MEIALGCFLGALFGFVLHRIGAANPDQIIGMLRLRDLHLMKAILFAIGFSSLMLFAGLAIGFIDPAHVSIKAASVGVIIGGVLLGVGWGAAGFCPGTGWAAVADGRKDAVFFVLGGLVGALAYMLSFPIFEGSSVLAPVLGGKTSLVATGNEAFRGWISGSYAWLAGMTVGALLMGVAWRLPQHRGDAEELESHPDPVRA